MADEFKLRKQVEQATKAKAKLEDETLIAAFEYLEKTYIEQWRVSAFRDADARERIWNLVRGLDKLKEHLAIVVANGGLAKHELDALSQRAA
jgi:hypothetical protein